MTFRAEEGARLRGSAGVALRSSLILAIVGGLAAPASAEGLTSAAELAAIRSAALLGTEPHAGNRSSLLEDANREWRWGSVEGKFVTSSAGSSNRCHPETNPNLTNYLLEGAPDAYAMALGAHLDASSELAQRARNHVIDLVDTSGFHGLNGDHSGSNKCTLELAFSIPVWIQTAELLERTSAWSEADGAAFKQWLAEQVFPRVAWASRARRNNWGTAGSAAAYAIARYVDGTIETLHEQAPQVRSFTPAQAAAEHVEMQKDRIRRTWPGDTRCSIYGVQEHGGIPDELRRGGSGCNARSLQRASGGSYNYQTMHAELLVLHAEAMRRDGDHSLYDLEAAPGRPAILQAILFVIANPTPGGNSWAWKSTRRGTLVVASQYYSDAALTAAAGIETTFRGGRNLPYALVTHEAPLEVPQEPDPEIDPPNEGEDPQGGGTPIEQTAGRPGRPFLIPN